MGNKLEKRSGLIRKEIERHNFTDELGEEYDASTFGGFPEYFRRKRLKLQNLDSQIRSNSTGKPQIFRGVVIHVNGYTQPSLNDIHHLVVSHGGGFIQYLEGKTTVTHIIAANLTPKKHVEFRKYRIVKPAWIVDSINAGKLLPWSTYSVIQEISAQRLLRLEDGKIVNHKKTDIRTYRDQTESSWYTEQFKKIVGKSRNGEDSRRFCAESVDVEEFIDSSYSDKSNLNSELDHLTSDDSLQLSESLEITSTLEEVLDSTKSLGCNFECVEDTDTIPINAFGQLPSSPRNDFNDQIESKKVPASRPDIQSKKEFRPSIMTQSVKDESVSPKKRDEISAEEHNSILLADPRIRKSTTANPNFISQYYSESRLHHLSVWKAELKSRLQMMAVKNSSFKTQNYQRKPGARRYIIHVDFDSFFCAVSLKKAPELADKPVAVAHGNGPGAEIASCNYPARNFGLKNGMWMKDALQLCPEIKVLPYDFPEYELVSNQFYEKILQIGGTVQSLSVDEALIDVTNLCHASGGTDGVTFCKESILREQEKADQIAFDLRQQVKNVTDLDVSVGIGPNILLAKVALRKAKPAGQLQIQPKDAIDHVNGLRIRELPGVAYSIGRKLEENGIKTVKDIRQHSKEFLVRLLGPKTGEKIWEYSHAIDNTEVGQQTNRKSISAEINWGIRFLTQNEAEQFIHNLCIELQRRLIDHEVRGRQLTVKIMKRSTNAPLNPPKHLGHGECDAFSKSVVFGVATNKAELMSSEAVSILRSYGFSPGDLRGLGVQMTKLQPMRATNGSHTESSQKLINFETPVSLKKLHYKIDDPIYDSPISERQKPSLTRGGKCKLKSDYEKKEILADLNDQKFKSRFQSEKDPIDEGSPQKLKTTPIHPASVIARMNSNDNNFSSKPLNISGTQFIIPTQIDHDVLAELPEDLQSKLVRQSKLQEMLKNNSSTAKPQVHSLSDQDYTSLPSHLDRDVFAALPDEMKAEVLANYGIRTSAQVGQPRTPHKDRNLSRLITKKVSPSMKRNLGRPVGNKAKRDSYQLDFFNSNNQSTGRLGKIGGKILEKIDEGLDPEFLSALPDDVRSELLNESNRKQHLCAHNMLQNIQSRGKKRLPEHESLPRKIILPAREPRPTFTTKKLSRLPQLRETISAWYDEFVDEGPHPEDVAAIVRYFRRVVLDERDIAKVVGLIRWLGYLISESSCSDDSLKVKEDSGTKIWLSVYEDIKDSVQLAVQERGLGRLEF